MSQTTNLLKQGNLLIALYNGSRQPIAEQEAPFLITVVDGAGQTCLRREVPCPQMRVTLPWRNSPSDLCRVIAWRDGYRQAGLHPVRILPAKEVRVDLMLVRQEAAYDFSPARWEALRRRKRPWWNILRTGFATESAAQSAYEDLMERQPAVLAAAFNLLAALEQVPLGPNSALDFLQQLIWDGGLRQDRIFAWASPELPGQVRSAATSGLFRREFAPSLFHPGATESYKQTELPEANLQITFHETECPEDGVARVRVELDIDYYPDPAAHGLLEVVPNLTAGRRTDPQRVYASRWMASRLAGKPEFDPLYRLV